MSIALTTAQESVLRALAASGRYAGEQQILDEALELLRQRDDLRSKLQVGIDQLDQGERIPLDEVLAGIRKQQAGQ